MAEIGYATLPIIPSLRGSSAQVERQLGAMLGKSGEAAGLKAGRQIGTGVTRGVGAAGVKAGEEIGSGVMKGAGAAGAKAGREIGVGVTRGAAGAGLKAGEEISAGVTKGASGAREGGLFANIGKGATVAGVGAGRRFGTALRETSMEYIKTIGTTMIGFMAFEKVSETFKTMIDEARESERVGRLTEQVIKSTGGVAHVTADQVGDLANSISEKVGVDDEAIQSAGNLMLTFRNVRNEAGKGNDMFSQSVRIVTDMAEAMAAASGGQVDFRSAVMAVGKALNDPAHGMSMLSKQGVTFTDQQKAQAKAMQANGNIMGAQKIIMRELSQEFGGAAAAMATPAEKLKVAWGNTLEALGLHLLPVIDKVSTVGLHGLKGLIDGASALPGPVRIATAALIAFKIAESTGAVGGIGKTFTGARAGVVGFANDLRGAATPALTQANAELRMAQTEMRAAATAARDAHFAMAPAGDKAAAQVQARNAYAVAQERASAATARVAAEEERAAMARSRAIKGLAKGAALAGAFAVASSGAADKLGFTNTATLALAGTMVGPWGTAAGAAVGAFLDLQHATANVRHDLDLTGLSTEDLGKRLRDLNADAASLKKGGIGTALQNMWGGNLSSKLALLGGVGVPTGALGGFLGKLMGVKTESRKVAEAAQRTQAKINKLGGQAHLSAEAMSGLGTREAKTAKQTLALQKQAGAIVGKFMNFEGAVTKAKGSVAGFEHQLAMQAKAMRNFANNAQKVANSGVRGVGGLVNRLAQMGPQGAALMAQLAHGSRRSIAQAVRDLGNWQGAGRRTAAILTRVLGSAAAKRYLMKLGLNPDPVRKGADAAKRDVRGVTAPKWLARVNADIGGLLSSVRRAQNALDGMHDKWVTVHTVYDYIGKAFNGKASGGLVTGPGSGTSDSIPTMLSNREFVVNAAQTAKYLPLLHAINSGTHGYAYGGLVTPRGAESSGKVVATSGGGAYLPDSLTVNIGGMDFEAYVQAIVDDRMRAAS